MKVKTHRLIIDPQNDVFDFPEACLGLVWCFHEALGSILPVRRRA
jgi:hypothetical protein